jgi:hypothetical protein
MNSAFLFFQLHSSIIPNLFSYKNASNDSSIGLLTITRSTALKYPWRVYHIRHELFVLRALRFHPGNSQVMRPNDLECYSQLFLSKISPKEGEMTN